MIGRHVDTAGHVGGPGKRQDGQAQPDVRPRERHHLLFFKGFDVKIVRLPEIREDG